MAALLRACDAADCAFRGAEVAAATVPPLARELPEELRSGLRLLVAHLLLSGSTRHTVSEWEWAKRHLAMVSESVLGFDADGCAEGPAYALAIRAIAGITPRAAEGALKGTVGRSLKELAAQRMYSKFLRIVAPYRLDSAALRAAESVRLECAARDVGGGVENVAWLLVRDWLICAAYTGHLVGRTIVALRRVCVALHIDEARLALAMVSVGEALRCESAVLRQIEEGASDAALQKSRMKWVKRAALIGGVSAVAIGAAVITGGIAAPAIASALGAGAAAAGVGAAAAGAGAAAAGAAGAAAAVETVTIGGVLLAGSAFFASTTGILLTAGTFGAVSGGLTAYTVHYRTSGLRDFSFVRCCDEDTAALSIVICVSGFSTSQGECIKFTVTFRANPADNLTRSPPYIRHFAL